MPHVFNETVIDVDAELQKAIRWHQGGQLQKAEDIYKKILASAPDHSDACHLFGFLSLQKGDHVLAARLIKKAINIDPNSALYHNSLGLVFSTLGQHDKAIERFLAALTIHPDYAEAHRNLGNALREQGRYEEAAVRYKHALKILPRDAELNHHLGRIMEDLGKFDEALDCYQKALEIQPNRSEAYNDIGLVLKQQGKFAEALSSLQKAVEIEPDCVEAHNNLGNLLQDGGLLEAAGECYRRALAIQPGFAKGHSNLGMVFQGMGKSEEAVACFRRAIEIDPDYASAYRHLVHQLQKDCSWSQMEAPAAKLDRLTKASLDAGVRPAEDPFLNLTRHPDPAHNFAIARAWSTDICRRVAEIKAGFSFDDRRSPSKPITIGSLSNNFHDHPMAHLLLGLFSLHDKNRFKINCYSCGQEDDGYYRRRIRQDCDKFVDLRLRNHLQAARAIYNDRVDILVDLMGHTRGSRIEICALRPAPIQVRYLGLAGTTGADFFDYQLTDKIVTPEIDGPYYSENFAYLPHCYQINDYQQANGDENWDLCESKPSTDPFIFCSFSQDYKIEPVMFDCWMQILQRVPDSVLWLMVRHKAAVKNLRSEAQSRGVNPDRLVFVERRPKSDHLLRLKKVDLALDTRLVNGAATTSDALWTGVPVITLKGTHFASRMSASILTAVGMPELIANSIEEFKRIAVQTALDPGRLARLRKKLAQNRLTDPLFDTPRFTSNLEQAFSRMWQIFQSGSKACQFEVKETAWSGSQDDRPKGNISIPVKEILTSKTGSGSLGDSDDISSDDSPIPTQNAVSSIAAVHPGLAAKKIAFFCGANDSFLKDICNHLTQRHQIRIFEGQTVQDIQRLMKWSDLSWFEWCDQLVIEASRLPKLCRMLCRLHRYEVFTDMPGQVDWNKIDDLIFVAPHIRDIARSAIPDLDQNVRTNIIHNGIDMDLYPFGEHCHGFNIAYVGYIHYRKNPSLLLQCVRYLVDIDERFILHIAGEHQDVMSKLYFDHMIKALKLETHIKFYGRVNDIPNWLQDKQYLLSTSIHESFGYGIAEAMACGIKPLIHNFICAREIYPEEYCFNSISELGAMVSNSDYHSGEYRKYIEDNYSLTKQLHEIESLLGICSRQI